MIRPMAEVVQTTKHFYKPDSGLAERALVGLAAELTEMVNSVREGRLPSVTGDDGRAALAAVQAAYRSAETGQWAEVV
jgi:predicted dehydrogenase